MAKSIEEIFTEWSKPPGKNEEQRCENAISAVKNAIDKSEKLQSKNVKVFVQGSYRNRVNVRQDSDVDIGVLCDDTFISHYPEGTSRETFGYEPAKYGYKEFKDDVEDALVNHFSREAVNRGNKAFDIHETSYHVDADVAPFFEYRNFWKDGSYRCGVALFPDNGGKVHNYPERLLSSWPDTPLHYENGVSKNTATSRAYKGVVRILKKVRNEMDDAEIAAAKPIPGFLIECLVWNTPDVCFNFDTWDKRIQAVLAYLWKYTKDEDLCGDWHEVNDIKYLFRSTQKWTRQQAHTFIAAAWDYIGVRK